MKALTYLSTRFAPASLQVSHTVMLMGLGMIAFASGCGQGAPSIPSASIAGTVTVNDEPLSKGNIAFIPLKGNTPTAGTEIQAGYYSLSVPKGDFRVEISAPEVTGKRKLYDAPDSPTQDIVVEALPAEYNAKSTLHEAISENNQSLNFNLKKNSSK